MFKLEGFDEFQNKLKRMQKKAKELEGEQQVPFDVLFNNDFMCKYTDFNNIDEMIDKSGFKVENTKDFEAIPDDEWDIYVEKVTRFNSWEEMLEYAADKYVQRKIDEI